MKFVITGGAGHISKPLAELLLAKGHEVTVVSRSEQKIQELVRKGAQGAIGSVEDTSFLSSVFTGADAVYTMVPPNFSISGSWKDWIAQIGKNYAQAIRESGVKHVVNLSSNGADLDTGCGPVTGLHRVEVELNKLPGVHIRHLRAANFYTNLLANISMIKNMGIIGGNFGGPDLKLVLVDPSDIASVAAEELMSLDFTGQSVLYIASDEKTSNEIARAIGKAIDKPDLPWVVFSDQDALKGMLQAGLPEEIAKNYQEMNHCLNSGKMNEDYWKNRPFKLQKTKIEDFAKTFAAIYHNETAVPAFG